jgi:hypothetical protein
MTQYLLPFVLVTLAVEQQPKPTTKPDPAKILFAPYGESLGDGLITESVGAFKVYDDTAELMTCEVEKELLTHCKITDGHTLDEVMRAIRKGIKAQQKSLEDELNRAYRIQAPASQPAQTPVSTFCAGEPDGNMFSINGKSYTCKDGQLMPAAQTPAKPSVTYGCIGDVDAVKAACPDQAPITCVGKWKFRKPKGWQCVVTSPPARKPASRECQPTTTVQDGR